MGKNCAAHFAIVLLLFLSFRDISAQTEEYEYYYEYEDSITSPGPIESTAVEMTTVTLVPQETTTSDPPTEVPVSAIPLVPSPTSGSTDEETGVDEETATAVDEKTPTALDKEIATTVSTEYTTTYPEQENLSIKYTMRPIFITTATGNKTVTQFNGSKTLPAKTTPKPITRTTPRKNSFQMPEIVLHIYTGMYGMHKQENKRRENSSNRGRNKSPSRNKISLGSLFESWYGSGYNGRDGQNSWNPTYARTTKRRNYSPAYTGNYGRQNSQANNAFDVFKMLMDAFASSARSQPSQSGRRRM